MWLKVNSVTFYYTGRAVINISWFCSMAFNGLWLYLFNLNFIPTTSPTTSESNMIHFDAWCMSSYSGFKFFSVWATTTGNLLDPAICLSEKDIMILGHKKTHIRFSVWLVKEIDLCLPTAKRTLKPLYHPVKNIFVLKSIRPKTCQLMHYCWKCNESWFF